MTLRGGHENEPERKPYSQAQACAKECQSCVTDFGHGAGATATTATRVLFQVIMVHDPCPTFSRIDTCHCLDCSLSYRRAAVSSANSGQMGIYRVSGLRALTTRAAMNHVKCPLQQDIPPLWCMTAHLIQPRHVFDYGLCAPFANGCIAEGTWRLEKHQETRSHRQIDGHSAPEITQYIPIPLGSHRSR